MNLQKDEASAENESHIPQGQAGFFVMSTAHLRPFIDIDDKLARKNNSARHQMPAVCPPLCIGQSDMGMNHGFAISYRYVTEQISYLQVLFDIIEFVLAVLLIVETKPGLFDGPKRSNAVCRFPRRQMSALRVNRHYVLTCR
ncbi:MAG: hypothetical protein ACYSWZ_07505 [Planctomycetota bacterium]